ncbi:MAG: DUF551 domain-containing protein [Psychrobacter sp.]
MSNLPLQPLVWQDLDEDPMLAPVSISESPLHHYVVLKDGEGIKVRYSKKGDDFDYATGFATIEDAKTWCWRHYNEKMQPYVKPMPTWISVDDRLPETDILFKEFLVYDNLNNKVSHDYWNNEQREWNHYQNHVTHWMPLPEFSEVTK